MRNEQTAESNAHVMKYIFPRQFGLHNVFTSKVSLNDTSHGFKDYTLRELELKTAKKTAKQRSLPKRLRGECETLVQHLRTRHKRCAYSALLQHYCPDSWVQNGGPDAGSSDVMRLATSPSQVSAFCRAVVAKVFPGRFWGDVDTGETNKMHIMHQIDRFVKLNRFESLTLHEVTQDIKVRAQVLLCNRIDP